MSIKDYLSQDMSVFFNAGEFSEIHIINGRELVISVDNDQLMYRSRQEYDGISVGEILYYVPSAAYGPKPFIGEQQIFDGRLFYIFDVREDAGIYEIILRQNGSE